MRRWWWAVVACTVVTKAQFTVAPPLGVATVPIVGGTELTLSGPGTFAVPLEFDVAEVTFTVAGVTKNGGGPCSSTVSATYVDSFSYSVVLPKMDVSETDYDFNNIPVNETRTLAVTTSLNILGVPITFTDFAVTIRAPLKIIFLYNGPITDLGWTYNWNSRRLVSVKRFEPYVRIKYKESVLPEDVVSVVEHLCAENYDLVVATSFEFIAGMLNVSETDVCGKLNNGNGDLLEYEKKTYMLQASGSEQTATLSTLNTKIYQLSYVSGVLAGMRMLETGDDIAGYLAPFPIPEVFRQINAFALGCRSVNPDCVVKILLTQAWADTWIELAGAQKLWVEDNARIIAQNSDSYQGQLVFNDGGPASCADLLAERMNGIPTTCMTEAEVAQNSAFGSTGAGSIGYNFDMQRLVGDCVLTSIIPTWDVPVNEFINTIFAGEWVPNDDYFKGTDEVPELNILSEYSTRVSNAAKQAADEALELLKSGVDSVFCGKLRKSDGGFVPYEQYASCTLIQWDLGECCLTEVVTMDYIVEGVEWAREGDAQWGTTTAPGGLNASEYTSQSYTAPRENDVICPDGTRKIWLSEFMGTCAPEPKKENRHLLSGPLKIFMLLLVLINFSFTFYCVAWTFHFRERVIVRLSQPFYMYTLCVGTLVTTISSIAPLYGENTTACHLILWLYAAGFVITTATLYIKMQQMHAVIECSLAFTKVNSPQIQTRRLEVFYIYFFMATGEIFILVMWYIVAPLRFGRQCIEKQKGGFFDGECLESVGKCRTTEGEVFVTVIATYHVICVLAGMYMCYKVRNLPSIMAEGKWVFTGFYSQLQVFVTAVPVLSVVKDDYETFTLLKSLVICASDLTTLAMIYIPKIILIYKYYDFDKKAITSFVLKSLTNSTQHDTVYEELRVKPIVIETAISSLQRKADVKPINMNKTWTPA